MKAQSFPLSTLIFSAGILSSLNGCISSSDSPDLTGSYSSRDFPSEPFTRRDSMAFSENRFVHFRRSFDPGGKFVYVKSHWGYYKIAGNSLRFQDIGRDSSYDADGIDLARAWERDRNLEIPKTWQGYAFESTGTGFRFREEAAGSGVWVTYLRK